MLHRSLRLEFHFRNGTHYILENPSGSLLFNLPAVRDRLNAHGARFVNVCLGALGAPSRKCVPSAALLLWSCLYCCLLCGSLVTLGS